MAGRDGAEPPRLIPPVFHRIWVGDPMPSHLAAYVESWRRVHPGWQHRLWTDSSMPPLVNQDLYDSAELIAPRSVGQFRADVARYELLARYGGVYVDCDFEAARPIDPLLPGVSCFAAWEEQGRWVNNAIMGATPGHPFLTALIDGLPANVERMRGSRPNKLSGPQYVTRVYRGFADSVTVFPQAWFYPYSYTELDRHGEAFPDAYAVHHWNNRRRMKAPT